MGPYKNRSKSFSSIALIALTAVVVALCAVSVVISLNMTSVLLKKHDQLTAGRSDAAASLKKDNTGLAGLINLKKAKRLPVFFNGISQEGLVCYNSGNEKSLLPIDIILNDLGAGYNLVNSDDAFTTTVNGKRIVLELGTGNAKAGGTPVKLGTASFAAENHVLASPEILGYIDGLRFYNYPAGNAAFTYYWPSAADKKYSGIRLFKFNGRKLEISDVFGGKPFSYGENGPEAIDEAVFSTTKDSVLVRSGDQYYSISGSNYKKPARIGIKGSWSISAGAGLLYRVDRTAKSFLIYNVKSASLKKLKDIYSPLTLINGTSLADCRLLGYETGAKFTRLDFEGLDGDVYTVISRSGKLVAQGSSRYSPDHSRILLYDRSGGWSLSGSDGRNIVRFKDAVSAGWVDNERILLQTAGGLTVYDRNNKSRNTVEVPFRFVGQSDDGRVFFAKGNNLYQKIKGKEKKIAELPWRFDFVCSATQNGPVVVLSDEADIILGISGDNTLPLGKPGLFPNGPAAGGIDKEFDRNASFSPDGDKLALLQKGDSFLEVVIAGLKEFKQKKLTLDYMPDTDADKPVIGLKWFGNDCLMVYTADRGWLLDFNKDTVYIHEWFEESAIAGAFKQAR